MRNKPNFPPAMPPPQLPHPAFRKTNPIIPPAAPNPAVPGIHELPTTNYEPKNAKQTQFTPPPRTAGVSPAPLSRNAQNKPNYHPAPNLRTTNHQLRTKKYETNPISSPLMPLASCLNYTKQTQSHQIERPPQAGLLHLTPVFQPGIPPPPKIRNEPNLNLPAVNPCSRST